MFIMFNCAFYVFLFQMYAANITNKITDGEFQPYNY